MPGYVIADVEVTDPDQYDKYKPLAIQSIQKFGGKVLTRGGPLDLLEGSWKPSRLVIIEFESAEKARSWYDSEDYRAARAIRQNASRSNVVLADEG